MSHEDDVRGLQVEALAKGIRQLAQRRRLLDPERNLRAQLVLHREVDERWNVHA